MATVGLASGFGRARRADEALDIERQRAQTGQFGAETQRQQLEDAAIQRSLKLALTSAQGVSEHVASFTEEQAADRDTFLNSQTTQFVRANLAAALERAGEQPALADSIFGQISSQPFRIEKTKVLGVEGTLVGGETGEVIAKGQPKGTDIGRLQEQVAAETDPIKRAETQAVITKLGTPGGQTTLLNADRSVPPAVTNSLRNALAPLFGGIVNPITGSIDIKGESAKDLTRALALGESFLVAGEAMSIGEAAELAARELGAVGAIDETPKIFDELDPETQTNLKRARARIRAGGDEQAVRDLLETNGIDPVLLDLAP